MNSDAVDDFLSALLIKDEERYALVERLRKLIYSVAPRVREEVKYGGLLFSGRSPFCGLFSYEGHVSLEFSRGALLPDRHKVLEGTGKLRRHIKIEKIGDLFKKNVREYLSLAHATVSDQKQALPDGPANKPASS
jgi:hypothetical protein